MESFNAEVPTFKWHKFIQKEQWGIGAFGAVYCGQYAGLMVLSMDNDCLSLCGMTHIFYRCFSTQFFIFDAGLTSLT